MDIQKIPPIHQKRIVTFVNYFIVDTVSFLNKFINSAEDSLWKLEKRMRKLETSLRLLEMKLNCIPDLPEPIKEIEKLTVEEIPQPDVSSQNDNSCDTVSNELPVEKEKEEIPAELQKYYKMAQVGVHINAVKLKMKLEGLDPNLLKL